MSKLEFETIIETDSQISRRGIVAVIGAGPYGLSLAAHLASQGIPHHVFGRPMETWRHHMPEGMALKSEGFASDLFDPAGAFPLAAYCRAQGLPYAAIGLPVPRAVFAEYGVAFQERFAADLDQRSVCDLARNGAGFRLRLEDGTAIEADRVVIATGIRPYSHVPPVLRGLPADLLTHSVEYGSLRHFSGRDVTVVGAGSSATDLVALLAEAGARPRLVARSQALSFHEPPAEPRPLHRRLRAPRSGLGLGWKSWLAARFPQLFRFLPAPLRQQIVRRHLGPAACWFVREQVLGKTELLLGHTIAQAGAVDGRVRLELRGAGGSRIVTTDHVIAATGFRIDLQRLGFLDPALRAGIGCDAGAPVLSGNFESSVPGLFFVGAPAAETFGPLLRFACGAGFAARRIAAAV